MSDRELLEALLTDIETAIELDRQKKLTREELRRYVLEWRKCLLEQKVVPVS